MLILPLIVPPVWVACPSFAIFSEYPPPVFCSVPPLTVTVPWEVTLTADPLGFVLVMVPPVILTVPSLLIAAAPELVAIAAASIFLLRSISRADPAGEGAADEVFWHDLFSHALSSLRRIRRKRFPVRWGFSVTVPAAALRVEHGKAEIILRRGEGAGLSVDPIRKFQPDKALCVDTDLLKKPWCQILLQVQAGPLFNDRAEHAGDDGMAGRIL